MIDIEINRGENANARYEIMHFERYDTSSDTKK